MQQTLALLADAFTGSGTELLGWLAVVAGLFLYHTLLDALLRFSPGRTNRGKDAADPRPARTASPTRFNEVHPGLPAAGSFAGEAF